MRAGVLLLLAIGAVMLGIGLVLATIGGMGEYGYYQCVASASASCTSSGSFQYYTVFLANSDILAVGENVLLFGLLVFLAGAVIRYIPSFVPEHGALSSLPRRCPKCGAQAEATAKFCAVCGNGLS